MSEKTELFFMGRFVCNFVHRQENHQPVFFRSEDDLKIWLEYATDLDMTDRASDQRSVLCVFKKIKLRKDFRDELFRSLEHTQSTGTFEFVVDPSKKHQLPLVFPSGLSDGCEARISQVESEITTMAEILISNLRWRLNLAGPGRPYMYSKLIMSEDRETWSPVPRGLVAFPDIRRDLVSGNVTYEIKEVAINPENKEPIAHILIRDAWTNHLTDYRGALMHAVTALEVGVKNCIARLVPDATFLVQELPSPPVLLLLREYLPSLFRKKNGPQSSLPGGTLDKIKNIVHQRNLLTHRGVCTVSREVVRDYIETIHDVLYFLDYASGDEWALALVSPDLRRHVLGDEELLEIDPVATKPNTESTNKPLFKSGDVP